MCHSIDPTAQSSCIMSTKSNDVTQFVKAVFIARFIADGNVYNPEKRTAFTDADRAQAIAAANAVGRVITRETCTGWIKNAYLKSKSEQQFRAYIGVEVEKVSNIYFRLTICCFSFN